MKAEAETIWKTRKPFCVNTRGIPPTAVLFQLGVPPALTLDGVPPILTLDGVPPALTLDGVPPILTLDGVPPPTPSWPGVGIPPLLGRMRVPPISQMVTLPPPRNVSRRTPVKTVPSPFLWNAGGKKHFYFIAIWWTVLVCVKELWAVFPLFLPPPLDRTWLDRTWSDRTWTGPGGTYPVNKQTNWKHYLPVHYVCGQYRQYLLFFPHVLQKISKVYFF